MRKEAEYRRGTYGAAFLLLNAYYKHATADGVGRTKAAFPPVGNTLMLYRYPLKGDGFRCYRVFYQ